MTVYLVISLPKLQYIHCIYIWLWPTLIINKHRRRLLGGHVEMSVCRRADTPASALHLFPWRPAIYLVRG
jgi:hypothetical protein